MKKLILIVVWLVYSNVNYSQEINNPSYYQIGAYADFSAEFIYLHYARIGVQKYLDKNFSIQGAFKVGSRTHPRWYISSDRDGVPTNWINWHADNPNGNPFFLLGSVAEPGKFGITSYPIQEHSLFYANITLSVGFDVNFLFKTDFQFLGGFGLRYTDEHYIGESGDAIFEYMGTGYEIYYLVPVYQRGLDGHLNLELNIVVPVSDKLRLKGGVVSDFTLGFMEFGVGNYYHAGISLQIKI